MTGRRQHSRSCRSIGRVTSTPGGRDLTFFSHLLSTLPAALVVVDAVGTVSFASGQAVDLIGYEAEDLIGKSVLEFVSAETAWAYAAAVAMATDYEDVLMGPLHISLLHQSGEEIQAELWAANRLDDPELEGITCVITPMSTAVHLSEVATKVAQDEPIEVIATGVSWAMRGHPVTAPAAVFVPDGSGFDVLGHATLPAEVIELLGRGPTQVLDEAFESGVRHLHGDLGELDAVTAEGLRAAGYHALWVEPVAVPGTRTDALVVVCRTQPGNPSPNELSRLFEGASMLALAYRLDRSG